MVAGRDGGCSGSGNVTDETAPIESGGVMKVSALIEALQALPPEADVWHLWDGSARTEIQLVWLARDGNVITSDYEEVCYSDHTRPVDAPSREQEPYWRTAAEPRQV